MRPLLQVRIQAVHPALPEELLGSLLYNANAVSDLTPLGVAAILRSHPIGVVRERSRGGNRYLVVTGLRAWQLLEAARHNPAALPRTVPVNVLPTMSDGEIRALGLADVLLSFLYIATPDAIAKRQMLEIAKMLGSTALEEYLRAGGRFLAKVQQATPRKRGRPRKKPPDPV